MQPSDENQAITRLENQVEALKGCLSTAYKTIHELCSVIELGNNQHHLEALRKRCLGQVSAIQSIKR